MKQHKQENGAWRPIAEAPRRRDAEPMIPILVFCPTAGGSGERLELGSVIDRDDRIRVAWWEPQLLCGIWYDGRTFDLRPSHWMPLPTPPVEDMGARS